MNDAHPPAEPPRRGWFRRNWLWFVPLVLLGLGVLCASCCGGILLTVFGVLRSSEPYVMALEQVQNDPKVIERLGEPIEPASWAPSGNIHVSNGRGDASLRFDVKGPRGTAHVSTQARRIDGQWGLTTLEVTFDDGTRLSLDTGTDDALDDAPPWTP